MLFVVVMDAAYVLLAQYLLQNKYLKVVFQTCSRVLLILVSCPAGLCCSLRCNSEKQEETNFNSPNNAFKILYIIIIFERKERKSMYFSICYVI